jgi:subtilisin family serine protease
MKLSRGWSSGVSRDLSKSWKWGVSALAVLVSLQVSWADGAKQGDFVDSTAEVDAEWSFPPEASFLNTFDLQTQSIARDWFLQKINAPVFWEKSKGSSAVKVLLCDTGVESIHPDLKNNIMLPGMNFVDGSTNTEPSGSAHGTHMAGIIGAAGAGPDGAQGINWNVQIVPGKVTNDPKGKTHHTHSAKCIRWGADQGIRVVNLSYSGAYDNEEVREAAKYLYDRGGILVMPSGNDGMSGDPKPFVDIPYIIVVAATGPDDWKMLWSAMGNHVDLAAPGVELYTTHVGGQRVMDKGTSASTALVSGAAALILSYRPELTASQLIDVLLNSTVDLGEKGRDKGFGMGRLDLRKALDYLK